MLRNPPPSTGFHVAGGAPPAPPFDLSISNIVQQIGEGFPATDLIKVLLQHISIDASKFARDVQSSNQIYYRSFMIYNAIQELMRKVDSSSTIEWTAFDQYTVAIPPLERILLKFYANYPEDKKRENLPPTTGVEDAVMFINRWEDDRAMLAQALLDLSSDNFTSLSGELKGLLTARSQEPRTNDDIDTIRALNTFFSASPLADRDIIQQRGGKLLTNVRRGIRSVSGKLVQNPSAVATSGMAIKILMIVYVPFAFISADATSADWKDYLKSSVIWQAMERLLLHLQTHIESQAQTPALADLDKEWVEFRDLLLKLSPSDIDTVGEILELLKLGANIRRPLHGRSVELIRMLYYLDQYSKKSATNKRRDLKLVLNDSIDVLDAAKTAVSDVKAMKLTDVEYTEQDKNLREVFSKIEGLFRDMNLSNEWPARVTKYNDSVTTDRDHLTMMRKRLSLE